MDTVTKNAPGGQPPRVKRVAAINDLSGFGRCSLTVALPILSAMGFQVCPAPTMLLSAHTGYPAPFIRDMTADLPAYFAHWERLGLEFEAVYTGFLGAPRQAALLEPFLQSQIRAGALCLVDPAMADHGRLYATCTPALVEAMKRLVALAAICTPNVTEACLLTDTDYDAVAALPPAEQQAALYRAGARLRALGCGTVVITGVPMLLASVCVVLAVRPGLPAAALLVVMPQVFVWLSAAFGLTMDLKRPNLTWTNEITVIKQRLTVLLAMLGGWVYAVVIGLLYLLVLPSWSAAWYLLACTALTALLTALLLRWLRTRGAAILAAL